MCRKKRILIFVCASLLILGLTGCGGEATTAAGGGLAAGGLAANTFFGMQADLEKARQAKLAELQAAVARLDEATTETERAVEQAKIRALEKTIEGLQDAQTATGLAQQGTELKWTDPTAVGGYGGTVIASLLAWYMRKKGRQETDAVTRKYQAHKQGVERFMLSRPNGSDDATSLYDLIGRARTKNGV